MMNGILISGTVAGALFAASVTAIGAEPVENAWQSASPVQVYGTAPSNRMPGQGAPIQLLNDPEAGGEVYFLLDGQEQSLKPGETMDLSADRPHTVEFNTGGNFGDVKFTLYQGQYKFKVMPEGWALFKSSGGSSVAGRAPATGTLSQPQMQRSFTPPMPAQDLRTRRVAGRAEGAVQGSAPRAANPPQPPSATTGAGQDTTRSIAAPPAPGVTRERTIAPKAP
jgi:hypothetical protein